MKKIFVVLAGLILVSWMVSGAVQAVPITLLPDQDNNAKYRDFTNLEDTDGSGHPSAGEETWSIFRCTGIVDADGNDIWQPNPGIELTGSLEGINFPAGYVWPTPDVVFDVTNASLSFWTDTTPDWSPNVEPGVRPGTAASAYSHATNGDLWLSVELIYYAGNFNIAPDGFTQGATVGYGNVLVNNTGYNFAPVFAFDFDGDGDLDPFNFWIESDLTARVLEAGDGWEFDSDDPTHMFPTDRKSVV